MPVDPHVSINDARPAVGKALPLPAVALHDNVLEQDHRFIKKRIAASLWFRSVGGALNTIAGYESIGRYFPRRREFLRFLAAGLLTERTRPRNAAPTGAGGSSRTL